MITVGFAGLGRMGAPMATNVAKAGFPLVVWNRSAAKADAMASSVGASVAPTPRRLAEGSDVLLTMLADDESSTSVHLGPNGLLAADGGATTLVAMGTHSPAHLSELSAAAGDRVVVDAPVSGSTAAAQTGQLLVMAGASDAVVEPLRPVLSTMAGEVVSLGRPGAGAAMKLAVNLLIHGLNQTMSEAMDLAESVGIAPEDAYRVIERSAAAAPMLLYRKEQYLDEAANPVAFALSLAAKDVGLAIQLGAEGGIELPQAELNLAQLLAAEAAGFGQRDMAAMVDYRRSQR